jgi:hypothetical protein
MLSTMQRVRVIRLESLLDRWESEPTPENAETVLVYASKYHEAYQFLSGFHADLFEQAHRSLFDTF